MDVSVAPDVIGTVGLCVALLAAALGGRSRRRPRGLSGLVGMLCLGVLVAVGMLYAGATGGITAGHPVTVANTMTADPAPGGLDVQPTATGSFKHSVPIQVPAFRGLEPGISLEYDSAAGNGEIGVGWRLKVGSSIVRSGPDGALPRYDAGDVFLVDGEKLVACAPSCATGGTHATRKQTFERYAFDGSTWTRWRRDGVRMTYQPDGSAAADPYRWSLTTLIDPHGNQVNFSEDCLNACLPGLVTYAAGTHDCGGTDQDPCKAGAAVRFHYELRPDVVNFPTGRGTRSVRQRLRTIEIRMDGRLVTAYALRYDLSPLTGASLLASVQQFPADANVATDGAVTAGPTPPLPPSRFTTASTASSQAAWTTATVNAPMPTAPPVANPFLLTTTSVPRTRGWGEHGEDGDGVPSPLFGDFDGDGRADVAGWDAHFGQSLAVRLATRGSLTYTQFPFSIGSDGANSARTGYVTDLNGDGADDIVLMDADGRVARAVSNRDGKFTIDPTFDGSVPWNGRVERQCTAADLNGDGFGDVACASAEGIPALTRIDEIISTPGGGWRTATAALPATATQVNVRDLILAAGDVDATGTTDIMLAFRDEISNAVTFLTGLTSADGNVDSWITTPTGWYHSETDSAHWSLSAADFDGDGRTDYALIRDASNGGFGAAGSPVLIGLSRKAAPSDIVIEPAVSAHGDHVATGDVDGDGRADLITGNPTRMLRSQGDGTFATPQDIPSPRTCAEWFEQLTAPDVNGDGQADLVCDDASAHDAWGRPANDLWIQPSPVAAPTPHEWRSFDRNGDGREDLYAIAYRNPDYGVLTLTAKPTGGYEPSYEPISSSGAPPGANVAEPDTSRWLAMDVGGGPGGGPDGRTDLVLVGRNANCCPTSPETLSITTLLSTGTGWDVRYAFPWRTAGGALAPYGAADVQKWRPADLNRDGRADLVHFFPLGPGVRVEYMLSNGDGSWTADHSDHFTAAAAPGGALTRVDVASMRIADLNRDGISDFVHVEVGGGPSSPYRTFRSLVSTGPASWAEQSEQVYEPVSPAAAHHLQMIDYQGDGIPDLGRAVVSGGCVQIEAYLRQGDGWSSMHVAGAPPPCQAQTPLTDARNLVLADVNRDGRTDVFHLSRVGHGAGATNAISTLLNGGDPAHWRWSDQPGLPIPDPDAWAWMRLDVDHDAVARLVHLGGSLPASMRTLRFGGDDDRLVAIDNGRGATTTIGYRALAGARKYLPAGMLPVVTEQVAVADAAYNPPVRASATFAYDGAVWSPRLRQLIGYATVRADQGPTVRVISNELGEACGARPWRTTVGTAIDKVLGDVETQFDPVGSAPYTCRASTVSAAECELSPSCLVKRTTYGYDAYGNIETAEDSGDTGRRRVYTPVHPNTVDYLVDRPYQRELLVPDPAAPATWVVQERTRFGYDDDSWQHAPHERGDLTRITQFTDLATGATAESQRQYDAAGNLMWTRSPTGVENAAAFDPQRLLFPTSSCRPVIGCDFTTWDETLGVPLSTTDVREQTTQQAYDAYARPTITTRPDGGTTTVRYLNTGSITGVDTARQRVRTEVSDGSAGDGVHWREELLDGLGRTYRTRDEGATTGNQYVILADIRYADASERPAATSDPHTTAQPAHWTTYRYDAAHRPVERVHPGNPSRGTSTVYRVGAVDRRDELGHLVTARHDAFGRIVGVDEQVTPCPGCPADTNTTSYTYDAADRLLTITDAAGQVTTTVRDAAGRETSFTDPDRGTRTRSWWPDGTLKSETDAAGTHTWTYDAAGRPKTRHDNGTNATHRARWNYDVDPRTGQPQGFSADRPTLVTYSSVDGGVAVNGSTRFWYDRMGRTNQDQRCVDAACQSMWYSYDIGGRLEYLRYPKPGDPDGEQVRYTYDAAGRLKSVGAYLTDIEYNPSGQPTAAVYGNGLLEQHSYDPDRGWVDSHTLLTTSNPKAERFAATYTHDAAGRLTDAQTRNPVPGGPATSHETFTPDELGRLVGYTATNHTPATLQYDALGRITNSSAAGTYHYDNPAHPHAVTSTDAGHTRGYDQAGNLQTLDDPGGRQLQIEWTVNGMPRFIGGQNGDATMAYDDGGQRVRRTTAAGNTYYLSRFLQQDVTGLTRYYWAGDQLVARRDPNGKVSYLLQDRQHSTRVITDQAGAVNARYNYAPFGAPDPANQQDDTSQRWQGQRSEPDNGLLYLNARFYDPELGQFTTADSTIPAVYRPQSLNRYSFSENDPVNLWDPSGHSSEGSEGGEKDSTGQAIEGDPYEWEQYPEKYQTIVHGSLSPPPLLDATSDAVTAGPIIEPVSPEQARLEAIFRYELPPDQAVPLDSSLRTLEFRLGYALIYGMKQRIAPVWSFLSDLGSEPTPVQVVGAHGQVHDVTPPYRDHTDVVPVAVELFLLATPGPKGSPLVEGATAAADAAEAIDFMEGAVARAEGYAAVNQRTLGAMVAQDAEGNSVTVVASGKRDIGPAVRLAAEARGYRVATLFEADAEETLGHFAQQHNLTPQLMMTNQIACPMCQLVMPYSGAVLQPDRSTWIWPPGAW